MTWLRVDDGMVEHPKIEALSDVAFRLHLRTLSYCARWNTDGAVPALKVELWGKPRSIQECLDAGIWHREGDVFWMHDFLEYNPSKADLELKKVAGAKGGAAAAANRKRLAGTVASARRNAVARARDPVPSRPDPDPTQPDPAREAVVARAFKAWESQAPLSITPIVQDAIEAWLDEYPIEWLEAACKAAGESGGRKPVRYVDAILRRWGDVGGIADGPKLKDQPGVHTADEFAGFGRPNG